MPQMQEDTTGGDTTLCASAALAIAQLQQVPYTRAPSSGCPPAHARAISIDLVVLPPLTENTSDPAANQPGDMSVAYTAPALDI